MGDQNGEGTGKHEKWVLSLKKKRPKGCNWAGFKYFMGCHMAMELHLVINESRQIGSGQVGDGKSECQHSRNQWSKMDWNGWI